MNTRTSIAQTERDPFVLESHKAATPIVRLWLLRMLVPLGAHKEFMESVSEHSEMEEDLIIQTLGLEHEIEQEENDEFDKKSALKALSKLHEAAEKELKNAKVPDPLANNIKQVAKLAKLSETDCRILEFLTLLHTERPLAYVVNHFAPLDDLWDQQDVVSVLSVLLALPQDEICSSLAKNSVLTKLGLVKLDLKYRSGRGQDLEDILELPDGFADRFVSADSDSVDLLQGMLS